MLTLAEFCQVIGRDRSTVLRKERQGLMPPRRLVAGMNVFLTAEVRTWLLNAEISKGSDPKRSAKAREIDGLGRWRAGKTKSKAAKAAASLAAPVAILIGMLATAPPAKAVDGFPERCAITYAAENVQTALKICPADLTADGQHLLAVAFATTDETCMAAAKRLVAKRRAEMRDAWCTATLLLLGSPGKLPFLIEREGR
jgi:predicted DNA-binding transcriptional regulator AlpA